MLRISFKLLLLLLIALYHFLLPISNLILKSSCYVSSIHATFPLAPWKSGLFMPQGPCMYVLAWNVLPRWLPLARFQYSKHLIYMWNIQKALSKSSSTHPLPISWDCFMVFIKICNHLFIHSNVHSLFNFLLHWFCLLLKMGSQEKLALTPNLPVANTIRSTNVRFFSFFSQTLDFLMLNNLY